MKLFVNENNEFEALTGMGVMELETAFKAARFVAGRYYKDIELSAGMSPNTLTRINREGPRPTLRSLLLAFDHLGYEVQLVKRGRR